MIQLILQILVLIKRFFADNFTPVTWESPVLSLDYELPTTPAPFASQSSIRTPQRKRTLRVLSHNVWGLPISPKVNERLRHVLAILDDWDIIVLQEAAHQREVQLIVEGAAKRGFHHHQFMQGVGFPVWNGVRAPALLVLSRYPIIDVVFKRYSVNGLVQMIHHSDYMGAKGCGLYHNLH
jgi:hypothetical protein